MRRKQTMMYAVFLVLTAALLGACASPTAGNPAPTPTPTPGESPLPTPMPSPGQDLEITLDNQGQTIRLQTGQRFLLKLGEQYNWTVDIADQSIVSRVIGITVVRGAQGIYEARQAGSTTLQASGDPACRQSKPPCAMPSILFQIQVVVQ